MVGYLFLLSAVFSIFIGTSQQMSIRPAQSVAVRGKLTCNGRPASDVLVKLYDHDTFTLDDKMASGQTDSEGMYQISGHAHEVSRITPKLNIYHDCNDWMPCQRKVSIYIPKSYITEGKEPEKTYDAGSLELSGEFEGESRDCFHKK
ncbi:transthyretin-like family domain-containing protein [Ditylenchus destructor]|uniref:Transthyretin-like family domain-containing protein n=1 Tax=Ditylenchus destructor TaxID=166010 RepID=A0AAD4MTQ3_9BILA|nr:transthyretin-like family domain-containing protein [Ditylenchus destructor]